MKITIRTAQERDQAEMVAQQELCDAKKMAGYEKS